ncbi:MAG TPA: hypothetical protein VGA99_13215 [bacterium]
MKSVLLELLSEIERNREESITRQEFWESARKTENNFQKMWQSIGELTEAQKKTEQRVNELTEAQKKTEQTVSELAQAQRKTEKALQKLTLRVDDLTHEVGGISNTVGYSLEDKSYPALKKELKRRFGLEVDRLYRKNLVYSPNKFDEINIYGEARKNAHEIYVIGESKAQFGPKDVTRFIRLLERVKAHLGERIFPLALAYHFHPQAEEKLQENQIQHFWSYELIEQ